MFVSNRPGGCGGGDIYVTTLRHRRGFETVSNLGCTINSAAEEAGPVRVGNALYFSSTRTDDARPFVRPDGREIVFDSNRPGGLGMTDVYAATKRHPWKPWSKLGIVTVSRTRASGASSRPERTAPRRRIPSTASYQTNSSITLARRCRAAARP